MQSATAHKEKIGLFGGTFNPVHLGHVRAAEEIREKCSLSKIIFIPAHIPPHKKNRITSARRRCDMVKLAIAGNPFFEVSEVELQRHASSYAFETIDYFNNAFNHNSELFFILGLDAFKEIQTWKHYPRFFSVCHFIIMSRPGVMSGDPESIIPRDIAADFDFNDPQSCYVHTSGFKIFFCQISLLDISSTDIRRRYKAGQSIKYLVPEAVEHYIKEHGLS